MLGLGVRTSGFGFQMLSSAAQPVQQGAGPSLRPTPLTLHALLPPPARGCAEAPGPQGGWKLRFVAGQEPARIPPARATAVGSLS